MSQPNETEVKNGGNASEPTETSIQEEQQTGSNEPQTGQEPGKTQQSTQEPTGGEQTPSVDEVAKLREQVENLKIALRKEREEKGNKVEELTKKLEETTAVYEKMKQAFVPEQELTQEPAYVAKEEVESLVEQKLAQLKEEQEQAQKAEQYKKEIEELQSAWNGKDGKPKYDDEEVLEWQQKNDKLYLSPKEAFMLMKHQEILDWEAKQRLAQQKPAGNAEQPGSVPSEHKPENTENAEDKANFDTRKAVAEAIEQAMQEM